MNFPRRVQIGRMKYEMVYPDELIREGAIHILDGRNFNPLVNPETVGCMPSDFSHGRAFYNRVVDNRLKLSEFGVRAIRKGFNEGRTIGEMARQFDISYMYTYDVANYHRRKDVPDLNI